jgi:anti-sigma factor RsiW
MKCEECQTLLEDYVDGALGEKAGALVNAHLSACSACTQYREQLVREQAIYANYERDVEVTSMLSSSIEARIKRERAAQPAGLLTRLREQMVGMFAAPRLSPALTFALVLIAIAITVVVMTRMNTGVPQVATNNSNIAAPEAPASGATTNANTNSATPPKAGGELATNDKSNDKPSVATATPLRVNAVRKAPATTTLTPAQLVREAEQKYLTAIAMLSRDVNRKRSQLDPTMLARFDSALTDIDRTIKDTRRVVRENPEDPIALQYLLAAYSKKVDVLRGMSASTD